MKLNRILESLRTVFFGSEKHDQYYFERFVQPHVRRGAEAGIPYEEMEQMWYAAVKESNPTIVGLAPGSLFRDKIDQRIATLK